MYWQDKMVESMLLFPPGTMVDIPEEAERENFELSLCNTYCEYYQRENLTRGRKEGSVH